MNRAGFKRRPLPKRKGGRRTTKGFGRGRRIRGRNASGQSTRQTLMLLMLQLLWRPRISLEPRVVCSECVNEGACSGHGGDIRIKRSPSRGWKSLKMGQHPGFQRKGVHSRHGPWCHGMSIFRNTLMNSATVSTAVSGQGPPRRACFLATPVTSAELRG
jgi:hypothetical protein